MLDTALRQLRYGLALVRTSHIRIGDLNRLVGDILATRAEFGPFSEEQRAFMQGSTDADARRAITERRWQITLRKAYVETVYYRHALDDLGVAPQELTLDRASELAPTPKESTRALPEAFVSARATPVFQAWTTGTTGIPTSFWFSRYELELSAGLSAISLVLNAGIGPEDVVQICVSSRAALGLYNTMQACRLIGAAAFLTGIIDPAETLSRMVAPVHLPGKKPQVSVLTVHPSQLGALVQQAECEGYQPADFGLDQIACAGEILTDPLRQRAEHVFGAPVIDNYAMTETFPVAGLRCREGHLHITDEQGLVEVLDPVTNEPAEPGKVGTLVITPFFPYRETMLVLRLATGDLVRRLPDEPLGCELASIPATSPLLGRAAAAGMTDADADGAVYQRDVLSLLEAEPSVPLPCRYAMVPADGGIDLHVRVDDDDPLIAKRLEHDATRRSLPIRRALLHTSDDDLPPIEFARAFLRETTVARGEDGAWTLR